MQRKMTTSDNISVEDQYFLKLKKCPVCGESSAHTVKFMIKYRSNKVIELNSITKVPDINLLSCKRCNHCFSSHILKNEILDNYYSNINSELYLEKSETPSDTHIKERKKIALLIENLIQGGGSVLDVGCGYGFLLSYLKKEKWKCYGIEPSMYASKIARANGINILAQYISAIKSSEYKFEIIIMMDVIEHLSDPNTIIKTLYNLLKPNGYLIIGSGNINSFNARICGAKWSYFGSYEHISFYTPQSISFLLKEHGFNIIKIKKVSHQGLFAINSINILKNIVKYVLFEKLRMREYTSTLLAFDHILVIARK